MLLEELPRVSGLAAVQPCDAVVTKSVSSLLSLARHRIQPRDLEMAALLLVRASRYAVIALLDAELEGTARQSLIDELSDMLGAYLLLPRPWHGGGEPCSTA